MLSTAALACAAAAGAIASGGISAATKMSGEYSTDRGLLADVSAERAVAFYPEQSWF